MPLKWTENTHGRYWTTQKDLYTVKVFKTMLAQAAYFILHEGTIVGGGEVSSLQAAKAAAEQQIWLFLESPLPV